MSMKEVQSVLKKTSFKESASTRKATSGMVERHLSKQRTAYDQWIAELCNDCENSAAERDRLREKLSTLRNDHKRKVMAKVIGRLGHMQIFMAWQAWYNATVKYESQKKELKLKELKKALKESVWPRGIESPRRIGSRRGFGRGNDETRRTSAAVALSRTGGRP